MVIHCSFAKAVPNGAAPALSVNKVETRRRDRRLKRRRVTEVQPIAAREEVTMQRLTYAFLLGTWPFLVAADKGKRPAIDSAAGDTT